MGKDINGVRWQSGANAQVMQRLPATEIGDLYFSYFDQFKDELLDYYVEATDFKGIATKSDIQHVYG